MKHYEGRCHEQNSLGNSWPDLDLGDSSSQIRQKVTLTVGSLFSGIGGLDLGLERAGMKVIWQSEIDPYCNKVLKKHWPEVINHGNIKDIDWGTVERPDIICGGYPCQPFSQAGKRRGKDDPRHLWPWVRDAISELRPSYAILENVRGHLTLGGLQVIGELAEIGYDAEWRVVSAASLGAPHRRDRIIIVAYPNDSRSGTSKCRTDSNWQTQIQEQQNISQFGISGCCANVADTSKQQFNGRGHRDSSKETEKRQTLQEQIDKSSCEVSDSDCERNGGWLGGVQQSSIFGRLGEDNERGENCYTGWKWWEVEPDVGRVAHGIPARVDRLRGIGNAVVPQVAEYIGRLVLAAELNNS